MKNKEPLGRVTVTISLPLMARLVQMRHRHDLSISSIAEVAIQAYLDGHDERDIVGVLRAAGASRRRPR